MPLFNVTVCNVTKYAQDVVYTIEADNNEAACDKAMDEFYNGNDPRWDEAEKRYLDGDAWVEDVVEEVPLG